MALITTAWLMGSEPEVPATTIDITANAVTETMVLPAGDYYPWNGLAATSALNQLRNAILSHSEVTTCGAYIGRDMLARLPADIPYSIDSWSDLSFRNVLGFTGTEAFSATTQTAGRSRYLWSPGRCEIPDAPLGSQGLPYHDTAVGMSGNNVVVATTNNSGRKNRFRFSYVQSQRVMTAAEDNGEYLQFWDAVVRRFYRWKLYRNITEEDTAADDTIASLNGEVLGPYKLLRTTGTMEMTYQREVSSVEMFSPVEIPCLLVGEY